MNENNNLFLEDMDKNRLKTFFNRLLKINELSIILPLLIVIVIFGLVKPSFLSVVNLRSIIKAASFHGIIVIGMAYSFIARQPDLSIGAIAGISAIISGTFIVWMGLPVWVSIIFTLIISAFIGLINGFLTVKLRIPPIISTLGTMFVIRGIAFLLSKGINIYPFPEFIIRFAKFKLFGLPVSFLIFFILTIILDFFLRRTVIGRKVYTTGSNVEIARIMGIKTDLVKMMTHIQVGILSAISGILYMFTSGSGSPNIGVDWEFPVIAAVVIGGISLLGGIGTVFGAFFGVILIQVLYNGLTVIGLRGEYEKLIIGFVMVFAASIDMWKRTRKT